MSSCSETDLTQSPVHVPTELRLVLLGRTGSGKSATGNTILNQQCFQSGPSMSSVTKQCQKKCGEVQGRRLAVIDTPGWFDTSLKQREITKEVLRCMVMCSPGPHAFLLIIPIARFTEEQQQTVNMIEEVFKENIYRHTIIVFTRADDLEQETIEQFINKQEEIIQDLIARFGKRFVAFNNKNPENREQVEQLLKKLDELLEQNEYRHFTNQDTEVVAKALGLLEQKKQEKLTEAIKQAKKEVKEIAEQKRAKIIKKLEEEKQDLERRRKHIQENTDKLTTELGKESEKQHADTLRLQEEILEKEKQMLIQKLDIWIKEEGQKREQQERERASTDDRSKWYNDEKYFTILMYIVIFMGGAGVGVAGVFVLAKGLLVTTEASAVFATELIAFLGPELSQTVTAAVKKASYNVAGRLIPSLCSIQ